ncbi:MAG: hypothetical protein HOP12_12190 [Candidatus Eisenbacteria bacterium]|uniref:Uncharacterized protein n=1 Tax=Eiseniibacteriota bacterium TaxID=2212470 RepID=A0A849SQJ9_UNCEI|nr:hypothetical protein [Candidatus Eisenbacteria bacterium]
MAVLDSITGQYNGFSDDEFEQVFGSKRDHLWSGRWSMLIPIAAGGAGVVFESVFSERFAASWKAGVVVTGGADSKKPGNAESSGTTSSGSNRGN